MDRVIPMLLGMVICIAMHTVLGMMPASVIGMYGEMLFGVRDSMAVGS
jgi:hypothetical protein